MQQGDTMGITEEAMKVVPTCRYGHGNLIQVTISGTHPRWGYLASNQLGALFSGRLFTCSSCGYTELFDDSPALTEKIEKAEIVEPEQARKEV
jgi:hypothetical protein